MGSYTYGPNHKKRPSGAAPVTHKCVTCRAKTWDVKRMNNGRVNIGGRLYCFNHLPA